MTDQSMVIEEPAVTMEPMALVEQINAGSMERAFCDLAQLWVVGMKEATPADCQNVIGGRCGLAGGTAPCLFAVPQDPLWKRVLQSAIWRMETDRSWLNPETD